MIRKCLVCGNPISGPAKKYCSRRCMGIAFCAERKGKAVKRKTSNFSCAIKLEEPTRIQCKTFSATHPPYAYTSLCPDSEYRR